MFSIVLSSARCVAIGACLLVAAQSTATIYTVTPVTVDSTLSKLISGDTVALVGTFGEVRLTNRTFTRAITIDASRAVFTTTMVLDNVQGVAVIGGIFNIGPNGSYAKGIAVYGGKNIYLDGMTVNGGADGLVDQFGVTLSGTYNGQVTNAKLNGLYSGISLGGVTGGWIAKNKSMGSTSDGIDIGDSHGIKVIANTCASGHPGPGAHPDCIQVWSVAGHALASDITITRNSASGPTQGFTDFDQGLRLNISNNTVATSYPAGVACYDCVNSKITGNVLTTLSGAAYQTQVIVLGGSGNTVSGNTVAAYNAPPTSGPVLADAMSGFVDAAPPFALDAIARPADMGAAASPFREALLVDAPAAVPEPSTWALLIAGFAAVGVARRRSRTLGTAV